MQDRYAGDVGDFGKISLLRYLFGNSNDRIGMVWYLFPDETHNGDGGHIEYITDHGFLNCDKQLCEKLSAVVYTNRSVKGLEKAGILPANTVYFSERLNFHLDHPSQSQVDKKQRDEKRRDWLRKAAMKVSGCNAVFLDPDNGLQIPSCPKISQIRAGKFAYYFEVAELAKNKMATVIYHHLNRHKKHGNHENQIRTRTAELREHLSPTGTIFALRFWPYSPRAYFILTHPSEEGQMRERLLGFKQSRYGRYWDFFYEQSASNDRMQPIGHKAASG